VGKRKRHLRHIWDGAIVCILTSPTSAGWCGKEWQVDMEEFKLILSITRFTVSALRNSGCIHNGEGRRNNLVGPV
jgi:hypothetical protein